MRAPGSQRPACLLLLRIFYAAAVGTGSSKMWLPIAIFAGRGMVAQLFKLLSSKRGQGIAITSYFKVVEKTLVSITSMRVVVSNRECAWVTLHVAHNQFDFSQVSITLSVRNSSYLHPLPLLCRWPRSAGKRPADPVAQGFAHDQLEVAFLGEHRHALPPGTRHPRDVGAPEHPIRTERVEAAVQV